jgi:hypothetical protein
MDFDSFENFHFSKVLTFNIIKGNNSIEKATKLMEMREKI